ncbi:MscS Mechanosensitive ion channel [Halothece sp. PCC 7418]|uniref:mechanosensitive ion channel family protein n=1 Tax=Halothece sp. (strain PCC 7418) TaxID=65093 RepID=UPI0002A05ADF|nr:mechanosensitive ion channel domain-containing protein [Halothece sp. PCC 7418]AFZ43063.1 MscS Mechanosensitive ion channel [Halothece sp. PCC 7418]
MESISNFLSNLPKTTEIDTRIIAGLVLFLMISALLGVLLLIPKVASALTQRLFSEQASTVYKKTFAPFQSWLFLTFLLGVLDLGLKYFVKASWIHLLEVPLALGVAILVSWVGASIFSRYFDIYLLDAAIQSKRKINSELLLLGKILVNAGIILVVIVVFAQTHEVNLFGLIASLGVGGLAVAFAAQKSLEQLLGGIVLYVDRPFVADDYIGLPDGTFGRVESIGLRSTRIRVSGKGTLMVVPNNFLTQTNIENFTGAKKVISMIYINFSQPISDTEKAFIRQVIINSTKEIFGIDPRSTEITFKPMEREGMQITQAQVSFFILGSGEVSMDLRRQLLDAARQNINRELQEFGISFDLEERTINVDAPITL